MHTRYTGGAEADRPMGAVSYDDLIDTTAALQHEQQLTQTELGRRTGTTQSAISDALASRRSVLRTDTLLRMLQAMNHTLAVVPITEGSPGADEARAAERQQAEEADFRSYALGYVATTPQRDPRWAQAAPAIEAGPIRFIEL